MVLSSKIIPPGRQKLCKADPWYTSGNACDNQCMAQPMHRIRSIGADSSGAIPLSTRAFEVLKSGTSVHDPGGSIVILVK